MRRVVFATLLLLLGGIAAVKLSRRASSTAAVQAPATKESMSTSRLTWCSGVIKSTSGKGIAKATVTIRSNSLMRSVATDAKGAFRFTGLPPGTYAVAASSDGYVSQYFGQSDPSEPMRTVVLIAGRGSDSIDVTLRPAGALDGRVVGRNGQPVADALISAQRIGDQGSSRTVFVDGLITADPTTRARTARSDRNGRFTLRNLAPGSYVVSAVVDGPANQAIAAAQGVLYERTFYRQSKSDAGASEVPVQANADRYLEWSLLVVPAVRLEGTVVTSGRQPVSGGFVRVSAGTESHSVTTPMATTTTDADGAFSISVPAGRPYTLVATSGSPWLRAGVQRDIEAAVAVIGPVTRTTGRITLRTTPGAVIEGTIVGLTDPPTSSVRVSGVPTDNPPFTIPASAAVSDNGTFALHNVFGCQEIYVGGANGVLVVDKASRNGRQIPDARLCVASGDHVRGVAVSIHQAEAEVAGAVQNDSGAPAGNSVIVLFPQKEEDWADSLSRYVRITRADDHGQFRIRDVVEGRYYITAIRSLGLAEAYTAPALARLRTRATSVDVTKDSRTAVRVTVSQIQ